MKKNLLARGVACIVIGAAVLVAPGFIPSPGLRETIAGSYLVGWFAVALGAALVINELVRRNRRR